MRAIIAGLLLGVAELTKATLLLLFILWPTLWAFYRWKDRDSASRRNWKAEAAMLAIQVVIAINLLNLGYGFEGSFQPLGHFRFVSESLVGSGVRDNENSGNRFLDGPFAHLPVPLPENYLLGADIQQRDFENYSQPSYLRGEFREEGWWYYYLYAGLVKVPLGLWGLLALRIVLPRRQTSVGRSILGSGLVLLIPCVAFFSLASCRTGFSEHFRYALPAFPFLITWAGGAMSQVSQQCQAPGRSRDDSRWPVLYFSNLRCAALVFLVVWFATSSLFVYPHSLSYFNEAVGGPVNGSRHLLGSNVDWGQDVLYLRSWIRRNQHHQPIYVAVHSLAAAKAAIGSVAPLAVDGDQGLRAQPGIICVSVNQLMESECLGKNGGSRYRDLPTVSRVCYTFQILRGGD